MIPKQYLLSLAAIILVVSSLACPVIGGEPKHASMRLPSAMPVPDMARAGEPLCQQTDVSVARLWNQRLLAAIRRDTPRPTVHARNLYHSSLAMYDAWAAFDPIASPVLHNEAVATPVDAELARREAISYAAYQVLKHRFALSPGAALSLAELELCMLDLGLDPDFDSQLGSSPAALGNRIAAAVIAQGLTDGSNEPANYVSPVPYVPVNQPMLVAFPGSGALVDVNAWQPLIPLGGAGLQTFLTPHWSRVQPFAITRSAADALYVDPGPLPRLAGDGDALLRANIVEVIRTSAFLDPDDGVMVNISPAVVGNNSLGHDDGQGYPLNPVTGVAYPENPVLRGDWARVLAEFWADGPQSSTPPGHWNEIANEVSDHPGLQRRIGGSGPEVSPLEWDVKLYLMLNGALHDNAIATWEVKVHYNSSRPITLIRAMGGLGQSSDPLLPSYHELGLPLEAGLIELITPQSSAAGERHAHLAAHIGEIALLSWRGHPANPLLQHGGVGWILAETWLPYQQANFVTPPFAGYTSGHSGFSRAAAEVLTAITGSPWFPGGLGEFVSSTDAEGFALGFEFGPSAPVRLQWASYYDAADEAGVSRVAGGIHPGYDDYTGRVLGHQVGLAAIDRAMALFGTPGTPVAAAVAIPAVTTAGKLALLLSMVLFAGLVLRQRIG